MFGSLGWNDFVSLNRRLSSVLEAYRRRDVLTREASLNMMALNYELEINVREGQYYGAPVHAPPPHAVCSRTLRCSTRKTFTVTTKASRKVVVSSLADDLLSFIEVL